MSMTNVTNVRDLTDVINVKRLMISIKGSQEASSSVSMRLDQNYIVVIVALGIKMCVFTSKFFRMSKIELLVLTRQF